MIHQLVTRHQGGRVHHVVNGAQLCGDLSDFGVHVLEAGDITGERSNIGMLGSRILKALGVDVKDGDLGAAACQPQCDNPAHSAGTACYQCHFACHICHYCSHLSKSLSCCP